jgi:hypothetical protein
LHDLLQRFPQLIVANMQGVNRRVDKLIAMQQALAFSGLTEDQIGAVPEQPSPPPWSE